MDRVRLAIVGRGSIVQGRGREDPASTGNVLIELAELPAAHRAH